MELERQHSHFQKKLDQRRRKKWKKVKEKNNIENQEKKNILESIGTNSSLLSTQSKLVNKTRNETLNYSLVPAVTNDGAHLMKDVSFSQMRRTATRKLMNSGVAFSNYINAELKVNGTLITDICIARYDNTDLPNVFCELLA